MPKISAAPIVAGLAVAWILAFSHHGIEHASAQGGNNAVNQGLKLALNALSLTDEEFLKLDPEKLVDLQSKVVELLEPSEGKRPRPGTVTAPIEFLALSAPGKTDLGKHADVPILVASRQTSIREWEARFNQNVQVVAVDLRTGNVTVANPFVSGKREQTPDPSMTGLRPEGGRALGTVTSVRQLGLHEILVRDLANMRLALTVLNYDRKSNTVVTHISGGHEPGKGPATRAMTPFLKVAHELQRIPAVGTVLFDVTPQTTKPGQAVIRAGIHIPLSESVLVEPTTPNGPHSVAVTVLLVRRDDNAPIQIDLTVPVKLENGAAPSAHALFGFDVQSATDRPLLPATYQAYLITGAQVIGPKPLTIEH